MLKDHARALPAPGRAAVPEELALHVPRGCSLRKLLFSVQMFPTFRT